MKHFKFSLYSKLLLLAGILEIIMVLIGLVSLYDFKVLNQKDKMRCLETTVLEAYQCRNEFSKKKDMAYFSAFKDRMKDFDIYIQPFSNNIAFTPLIQIKNDYNQTFNNFVQQMAIRGLNESKGVEGDFRKSVHEIERIIEGLHEYKLYNYMLQARRSEKDYIMRRSDVYILKVHANIDSILFITPKLSIPQEDKDHIIFLAKDYYSKFQNLVISLKRIDELETQLINMESSLGSNLEILAIEYNNRADFVQIAQFVFIFLSICSGVVLSILIARNISRPVTELQKAANKLAQGDFNAKVKVDTKDEIEDLANAFNAMIDNIKESNETILFQQEELKESNSALAGLADELKISFNNLASLSEIGQSINSTLNFDDLFDKIFTNIVDIIQADTFKIGIINSKNKTLDFRLVIKNKKRISSSSISLDDKSRIEISCINANKELFIENLNRSYSDICNVYPFIDYQQLSNLRHHEINSIIYIPIAVDNNILGIITAENLAPEALKMHHIDMLWNLSSYISVGLANANSYKEVKEYNEQLKKTQAQLIQAEKMASLGQLTTGIAHEIKNPLNFINNYADGTVELFNEFNEDLTELKNQNKIEDHDFESLKELTTDISNYLQTIINNGKRIDKIVKSMMEHARGGSGEKVMTKINTFLQDYNKLSYNGFKGTNKQFIVALKYDLDTNDPLIPIMQQELSRVITNIIDNACYSCKKKKEKLGDGYSPQILTSTQELSDSVIIKIRDNGLGVSQSIIDKVFHPFFTTKPTGEGTGLGLSLSYDIVTNAHNGKMDLVTEEGEFAEFIITLPKE